MQMALDHMWTTVFCELKPVHRTQLPQSFSILGARVQYGMPSGGTNPTLLFVVAVGDDLEKHS